MRVIIAEDEQKVAQLIKRLIPWEEMGLELVATAQNGQDAYEFIHRLKPDAVIIDIRMPKLDGLEVIRRTVLDGINTRFIIVSGYRYFEYAHSALRYGVDSYLLKPVNRDELIEALKKISVSIQQNRIKTAQDKAQQASLNQMRQTDFLLKLLSSQERDKSYSELKKAYNLVFDHPLFCPFAMKIDYVSEEKGAYSEYTALRVKELVDKELKNAEASSITAIEGEYLYGLINLPTAIDTNAPSSKLLVAAQDYAGDCGPYVVTAVTGETVDSLSAAVGQLKKAIRALDVRIVKGAGNLYSTAMSMGKQVRQEDWNHLSFQNALESGNEESLKQIIDEIFARLENNKDLSPTEYYKLARDIAAQAFAILTPYPDESIDKTREQLMFSISNATSEETLKGGLVKHLTQAVELYKYSQDIKQKKPVRDAISYIEENYARRITLAELAEHVNFNTTYFCTLFKKETGMNFGDYLTQTRMEAAKDKLRSTNLTIPAIAEACGYRDTKYFTQQFSKIVGSSPARYRRLYS